jgi:hypothetical protein
MAKVLVSMDEGLLAHLDREAAIRGVSRSALLSELAAKGLGEPVGPGARPDVHEALRRVSDLFAEVRDAEDSTSVIRQMRDAR